MKYIKTLESIVIKLKPGFMYNSTTTAKIGFIGYNEGKSYPLLCILIEKNNSIPKYKFIEWSSFNEKQFTPLNISIKDYIIKNNIVVEFFDHLENPTFISGGCEESLQKIKKFRETLLKDANIHLLVSIKKYNL